MLTKIKFGSLLKEPGGIFESGLQTKWFELTADYLFYYDSPKDNVPKSQWNITKDWKVYTGNDTGKFSSTSIAKHIFHFQIEINKTTMIHFWDTTEEGRQDWINSIQKAINLKRQESQMSRSHHH